MQQAYLSKTNGDLWKWIKRVEHRMRTGHCWVVCTSGKGLPICHSCQVTSWVLSMQCGGVMSILMHSPNRGHLFYNLPLYFLKMTSSHSLHLIALLLFNSNFQNLITSNLSLLAKTTHQLSLTTWWNKKIGEEKGRRGAILIMLNKG